MRTSEIAKRFLDYFEQHDHLVVPSASLISPNPTTLFTIAGMVPFIPYLMGEQTPPKHRMASNQKCVRTLDIDEVGKTTRHGTFFQMLGNFSFGDYFKEEAIHYAYELLTTPQDKGGYGFDPEKLWMTTFTDDEEARSMWKNEGVDPEHIQIMGMEDNFWTTGGPGPGGPCSEIYVDRGPKYGVEGGPIADENRYIEIWDLVFENYEVDNVKSKTDLHIVGELENKNIDTGAGLERLAYLMQGKQNIYEHSVGVPLVMAGPGIPQNERREQLCYLLDVYPTLCELCGVEIPASVEGKSLLPVLQNADARVREELYLAFQARIRGVMDERFKLLEYRTENLKLTQLFDLQNDPWEKNNCFDLAGYEEITARLRERLLALRDEWDDAKSKHGSVYWQAWENYEKAVVVNPSRPTGSDPAKQLALSK